jgi:hypothetical protein
MSAASMSLEYYSSFMREQIGRSDIRVTKAYSSLRTWLYNFKNLERNRIRAKFWLQKWKNRAVNETWIYASTPILCLFWAWCANRECIRLSAHGVMKKNVSLSICTLFFTAKNLLALQYFHDWALAVSCIFDVPVYTRYTWSMFFPVTNVILSYIFITERHIPRRQTQQQVRGTCLGHSPRDKRGCRSHNILPYHQSHKHRIGNYGS